MYKEKFDTERPLRWECVSNETDVKLCGLWSKNRKKAPHSPTDSTWNPFESNNKSKIKIDKVVNNSGGQNETNSAWILLDFAAELVAITYRL